MNNCERVLMDISYPRQWADVSGLTYKTPGQGPRFYSLLVMERVKRIITGGTRCSPSRLTLNHPSMKRVLKSSTNLDTQLLSRHKSDIENLTINVAPNI